MNKRQIKRLWRNTLLPALAIAVFAAYQYYSEAEVITTRVAGESAAELVQAYHNRRSGLWVEVPGRVSRIMADDREESRHQRFILQLGNNHTVLVAHNIDLARRVPLQKDDELLVRGRYEWNERGGVIHWTHHDPGGGQGGGWIEYQGRRYH